MASARWPDPMTHGEGHQSSKASLLGVRYVVGVVVVSGHWIRGHCVGSLVGRRWRVYPVSGVWAVAEQADLAGTTW
jgi:hypothetical protein